MKAQAIVFRDPNIPKLESIEIPSPGPTEVRVRTAYSGVSIGTESSIFSGARTHNGTFPLVGGYMTSGIVEEAGSEVDGLSVGDAVVTSGAKLEGDINSIWGGHMSMSINGASGVVRVPENTQLQDAAMFMLPNVGLNAVSMAGITEQDTVLIFGQGLIGQFFSQFAGNRGARIIAVEPSEARAALSRKYVTEYVLDPFKDDLVAAVSTLTGGNGPSIVVEATALAKNVPLATSFLRPKGKMVFLSWYPGDIELKYSDFHNHEVTAFFSMGAGNRETTRATLHCMGNGAIVVGENLTDIVPCGEACEGYRRIIEGGKSILGMVVDWRAS